MSAFAPPEAPLALPEQVLERHRQQGLVASARRMALRLRGALAS